MKGMWAKTRRHSGGYLLGLGEVVGERALVCISPHLLSLGPDNRNLKSNSLQAPALQEVRVVS